MTEAFSYPPCNTADDHAAAGDTLVSTPGTTAADCCIQCNMVKQCQTFTFDKSSQTCELKESTDQFVSDVGKVAGKRSSTWTLPRACGEGFDKFPFCDTSQSHHDRIVDLISRLDDKEKAPLLTARESPNGAVLRLGLPEYDWGANCVHGVQSRCGMKNGEVNCPTSFPSPNALGASFNMSLSHDMAAVIATELRALWLQGVGENHGNNLPHLGLDCWSPNHNLARDPRWGRNQEVPTEDPFLASRYSIAYTKGLQEGEDGRYLKTIVTLKHWAAYSLEDWGGKTRHNFDAVVDAYNLADSYFPAWKDAVLEANAKGVMCSYNALNGVPTCASSFLDNILRDKWGFEGYVTSDTGAVADIYSQHKYVKEPEEAACAAIRDGGCDINSGSVYLNHLLNATQLGLCSMDDVDRALYNSLKMRFELGLMDPIDDQPYWHYGEDVVNTEESQALNLLSAQQSMVLLKNDDHTLPFNKGVKLAVVGPHANATKAMVGNYLGQICPGGSSDFSCITSPFVAIDALNVGGDTVLSEGCSVTGNDTSGFDAAVEAVKDADYVVMVLGIDQTVEGESKDRTDIDLPEIQHQFAEAILKVGKPTAIVLINGGMVAIEQEKETAPAIVEAFYPGYQGGRAIADVIFGDYNPGGKLPVTIYKKDYINDVDMFDMDFTQSPGRTYKYYTGEPLWPFGYGLSYTDFALSLPESSASIDANSQKKLNVRVTVKNVGSRDGDEVVMVFLKPVDLPKQPNNPVIRQLIAFERIGTTSGNGFGLNFEFGVEDFKLVNVKGDVVVTPGSYQLEVTNGVDQTVQYELTITGNERVLDAFGPEHGELFEMS